MHEWQTIFTTGHTPIAYVCSKCEYSYNISDPTPIITCRIHQPDPDLASFERMTGSHIPDKPKMDNNWHHLALCHRRKLDICSGAIGVENGNKVQLCKYCAKDILAELKEEINFATFQYKNLKNSKNQEYAEYSAEWKRLQKLYNNIRNGILEIDKCTVCNKGPSKGTGPSL